jgi:hypothetical protein
MVMIRRHVLRCLAMILFGAASGCCGSSTRSTADVSQRSAPLPIEPDDDHETVARISSLLHAGMTHDQAIDALGVVNPFQRNGTIGDLIQRAGIFVSPRFPGFTIALQEQWTGGTFGVWAVTAWTVSRDVPLSRLGFVLRPHPL